MFSMHYNTLMVRRETELPKKSALCGSGDATMSEKFRNLPNCITGLRIILALCMLPVPALSVAFYVLHTLCAVSDVADGFLARRCHLESELGARLDSVADLLFWGIVTVKVLCVIWPQYTALEYTLFAAAVVLRLAAYGIALRKFRCFPSLHTWLNKLTGFALFVVIYLLNWFPAQVCNVVFVIAIAAALEEMAIHLNARELKADTHSLAALFRRENRQKYDSDLPNT